MSRTAEKCAAFRSPRGAFATVFDFPERHEQKRAALEVFVSKRLRSVAENGQKTPKGEAFLFRFYTAKKDVTLVERDADVAQMEILFTSIFLKQLGKDAASACVE